MIMSLLVDVDSPISMEDVLRWLYLAAEVVRTERRNSRKTIRTREAAVCGEMEVLLLGVILLDKMPP